MTKVILYIATSADGFIATKDGGVDWLPHPDTVEDTDEFGYQALMERTSVIVMGSKSYQQILGFGDWAWPDKLTYVFTSQDLSSEREDIIFVRDNVTDFIRQFAQSDQNIWLLGGAELIGSFTDKKLIDECIITVVPTSLGEGIKLRLPYEDFTLRDEKVCWGGMVQRCYGKGVV